MDAKAEELSLIVEEIRTRVRARHPSGQQANGVSLPDLLPLMHARDAAEGKVASIGSVNPRPPGLKNAIAQWVKRMVARALDWHIREQIEFNRALMQCVQATLDALNESNRALTQMPPPDLQYQLAQWRKGWDERLAEQERSYLLNLAELQNSFQNRVALVEASYQRNLNSFEAAFRDLVKSQHREFSESLARSVSEIQKKLGQDFARFRAELDTMIHSELRILRQRAMLPVLSPAPQLPSPHPTQPTPDWGRIDWLRFSERFRGSEEYVRGQQELYARRFAGYTDILDVGCGRGELLETLKAVGIQARGIELSAELAAICCTKGLPVEQADLFEYLASLEDKSLGAVACMQVVEHLERPRVFQFVQLAYAKLRHGGLIGIETPNPECLAIFASHFYLDPTHQHPLPPGLLAFYLEEAGFAGADVIRLSPALESMPEVAELSETFRERFFGALDYVIFAHKP